MNPSIETTIRSHLRANDAAQQTIEWAEIVERIENQSPAFVGPGPGRRIGVWVAVVAAVVTIMLIGVVPLLVGGDETPPADTVVPTTLTDASPPTTSVVVELDGEVVVRTTVGPTQVSGSSIGDIQLTPFDVLPSGLALDSMKSTPLGIVSVGSGGELLISDDGVAWRSVTTPFSGQPISFSASRDAFHAGTADGSSPGLWASEDLVTWTFEEPRSESGSGIQLSLAEWLDGPDFVVMEFGEYKSSAVTPQGSQLAYATWAIDWKSVAGLAGGEALQLRLNGDEVLGANIWDPTTGLVDFTLFESQTARDRYSMGDSSVGPESAGVQLRMTISGPTDAWVVSLEDAASGTSLGSIQGSLPPRGLEDTALSDFTLDDVLEYVATNGRFGSHFLVSDDGLELVDQPPWVSLSGEEPTFFIEDGQMHANWFFQDTGTWQSPDGRAWSAVFAPGSFDGMSLDDVIHEGPGDVRVAVADVHGPGFDVEGQPPPSIIHLSVDGVEWAPPRQPPTFVPEVPGAVFVSATDEGFLLVAQVQEPRSGTDGPSELMIWTSVDGDIWEQADSVLPFGPPLDDAQQELRAISGHSVVILIGKDAGWIINTGN